MDHLRSGSVRIRLPMGGDLLVVLLVIAGLLASPWASPQAVEAADMRDPLPEKVRVRIASLKSINVTQSWLLPELAAKYNIDVELVEFQRFVDVRTALVAREIDFGVFGSQDISLALAGGATNLVGLAGAGYGDSTMVVRKGVEVNGWGDLKGLRVGIGAGSISWIKFAVTLSEQDDVQYSDLRIVNIAGSGDNYVLGLERGDLDVAVTWEPFGARAVLGGFAYYPPISPNDSRLLGGTFGVFAGNRDYIRANPEVTQKVVLAYAEAVDMLRHDRDLWYRRAAEFSGLDLEVVKVAVEGSKSELDYAIPLQNIVNLTRFMYENGVITRDVTASVPGAYDFTFLSKAVGKSPAELGAVN